MKHRIKMLVGVAVAALVATATWVAVDAPAAQAFGGETFGCRFSPGTVFTFNSPCLNNKPAPSGYTLAFEVQNLSGSGYTFSWTLSGDYLSIFSGCTSTSVACVVTTPGSNADHDISATVTYSQGGQSATKQASAFIRAYCGNQLC